jgi:hypothetical protein
MCVGLRQHVAVPGFDRREIPLEPAEVLDFAPAGQARKHVVDGEEELSLGEIHQQCRQVVASLLELNMLPLMEIVDSYMDFRTAGHAARQLLAKEKFRIPSQLF